MDDVTAERDFYLRILQLGQEEKIELLLAEALSLITEISGARKGYIELAAPDDDGEPFSLSKDLSDADVADVREKLSGGIIAEAMATGEVVYTPSAMQDVRFSGRQSVKLKRIGAALCAPIGSPPLGVIYLQGRLQFSPEDKARLALFARHLAPLADRLLRRVQRVRDTDRTLPIRAGLRNHVPVVGRGRAMAKVLQKVRSFAPHDITVLLTGPTGTGKTHLARLIADNSERARGPFVQVNAATLKHELVESQLFGAVRGAHSTATQATDGLVAAAEGGTLFLDEVSEIPIGAQAALLQFLNSGTYCRLGGTRTRHADVRIIAATNCDLAEEVRAGRFREDLMYRINVVEIAMPPLSARTEDIPVLAEHLCRACTGRSPALGGVTLSPAALSALRMAPWPGNVRQLKSAIERAVILAVGAGRSQIAPAHLFAGDDEDEAAPLGFQDATRQFQRDLLLRTLAEADHNVSEAARRLGLARSHIYNLIKQHGLKKR